MSYGVINVNSGTHEFITFCQGSDFKKYVRDAIDDRMFWNNIITNMNLNSTIESKISSTVPKDVKNEVDRILPGLVETEFMKYSHNKLPKEVVKEVSTQMVLYLNNNYQMQQILETHKSNLNKILESSVREIMDRIMKDPKYQEVCDNHLRIINQNADNTINEMQKRFDNEMNLMIKRFNNQFDTISNLQKKVTDLEKSTKNIEKEQRSNLKIITTAFSVIGILGISSFLAFVARH